MPRTVACLLALLFTSVPSASAQWPLTSCTTLGKNLFVRDVLTDLYLWYADMPGANPGRFRSPEAYLEAVRFRPLDTTFSYITSRAANDAFFDDSAFVGFGFSTQVAGDEMRILQVFPDSPASEAGLARGARIVAIDGRPVPDLIAEGSIDTAFGPAEAGAAATIDFVLQTGERRSARLAKRVVTIPTVSLTRVYEVDGRRVGYIFFRNFVRPSNAALDAAFAELAEARVDDLVLDLRYNGGGLVNVARHLASVIGGIRTRDHVFAQYVHNDRNVRRNEVLRFEDGVDTPGFDRLIVITTRASASASELVINALRPFIPVVVIGDRTYGKPVGQYQIDFCDKMLAPVAFTLRNANGEGDYFNGLAADCEAPDDTERELGDTGEASLREALTFAATGACTPRPRGLQRRLETRSEHRVRGWQSVLNAY
jgi:C-terminal processing protease CtpA/Prc